MVIAFDFFCFRPWLAEKLETAVKQQSRGFYTLQMGGLHTSLFTGSLTIDKIRMVPDFTLWEKQRVSQSASLPAFLVDVKAKQLQVKGLDYFGLLGRKAVALNKIIITQPVIQITRMREGLQANEPLHQKLKGLLVKLQVEEIQATSGIITYKSKHKNKWNTAELKGVDLKVNDLQVDSASFKDRQRVLYARAITCNTANANLLMAKGYYRLKTGRVTLRTEDQELKIRHLALQPVYKPEELARRKGKATTWLALQVPDVALTNMNFYELVHSSNIVIGTIRFRNPDLRAYLDRKNFRQTGEKPLPHDLIQKIKTGLTIRKILISNMQIRYEELAPAAKQTGLFTSERVNASLTNISNDKKLVSAQAPAVINLRAELMGKAPLQATIRLNLLDPDGFHTLTGSVGETKATIFNSILAATSFVRIKSGVLQKCSFQVKLYRSKARGTMRAYYRDVKIELLSKDKDKYQSWGKKALSVLFNNTVLESNNSPDTKEGLRVGQIAATRKKNRSVFNYWLACLVSGFLSSAGL